MLGFNKKAKFSRWIDVDDIHAARIEPLARQAIVDCRAERAMPEEFADWIEGHLKNGGKVSHICDYDMWDDFLIARKDACIPGLYGAARVQFIAPKGILLASRGGNGHNHIYSMDGFDTSDANIDVFKDVARILRRRGYTKNDLLKGLVETGKMKPPPPEKVVVYKPLKLALRPPGNGKP